MQTFGNRKKKKKKKISYFISEIPRNSKNFAENAQCFIGAVL